MFWSWSAAVTLIVLSEFKKFHPRLAAPQMMKGEPTDASGSRVAVELALAEYWLTPITLENAAGCVSAPPTWTPAARRSWGSVAVVHGSRLPSRSVAGLPVLLTSTQLGAELERFCDSLSCTVVQIVVG